MPSKLTRKTLTEKHFGALKGRARGLTFAQIARSEGITATAIQRRFRAVKPFLHPLTLARLYPDHTAKVVALRLSGKTLRQIESETGLNYDVVHRLLRKAAAKMNEKKAEKLAVGGTKTNPSRVTRIASHKKATGAFLEEVNRFANPYGALKRAAQRAGLKGRWSNLTHHLSKAGINWKAKVRQRRLALALKVADTMYLPREEACKVVGIGKSTLNTYRRKVRHTLPLSGEAADVPEETALKALFEKIKRGQITLPGRTKQFAIEHIEAIEQTKRADARPDARRVRTHIPNIEAAIDQIRAFRRQFAKITPLQRLLVARKFGISMSHPREALIEAELLSRKQKARELEAAYATLEQHPTVKKLI